MSHFIDQLIDQLMDLWGELLLLYKAISYNLLTFYNWWLIRKWYQNMFFFTLKDTMYYYFKPISLDD